MCYLCVAAYLLLIRCACAVPRSTQRLPLFMELLDRRGATLCSASAFPPAEGCTYTRVLVPASMCKLAFNGTFQKSKARLAKPFRFFCQHIMVSYTTKCEMRVMFFYFHLFYHYHGTWRMVLVDVDGIGGEAKSKTKTQKISLECMNLANLDKDTSMRARRVNWPRFLVRVGLCVHTASCASASSI